MENIEIIRKAKPFSNLSDEDFDKVFPELHGTVKHYQKGEIVVVEGDRLGSIGVVVQGEIDVIRVLDDGKRSLIKKAFPPYVLGIDAVCTRSQACPYSIESVEDSSLYFVDYSVISKPGSLNEEYRLKIMDMMLTLVAHDNIRKYYTIEILSKRSLREKILSYLEMQQRKVKTPEFSIYLNREQLAEYLAVNRSALSHELAEMKKDGLIDYRKNRFRIIK